MLMEIEARGALKDILSSSILSEKKKRSWVPPQVLSSLK